MVQLRFQLLILQFNHSPSGEGCVMKSTVINSSKEMTAYSDYPPPSDFANFMHHTQMLRYYKMYAEHHDLLKHIKFNHCVTNVSRTEDFVRTGQWTVNYLNEYCTGWCNENSPSLKHRRIVVTNLIKLKFGTRMPQALT